MSHAARTASSPSSGIFRPTKTLGRSATAEAGHYKLETVLLQARDVGAAIVDEATERGADLIICGLPFRRRFGGDFAIGSTIPYVLKNAPCATWVVREAMPEEQA